MADQMTKHVDLKNIEPPRRSRRLLGTELTSGYELPPPTRQRRGPRAGKRSNDSEKVCHSSVYVNSNPLLYFFLKENEMLVKSVDLVRSQARTQAL